MSTTNTELQPESPAAEFYRLRNDRMKKCMAGRLPPEMHCVVTVDPAWSAAPGVAPAMETVCNLVARFCRRVTVVMPGCKVGSIEGARLVALMAAVDPFGAYQLTDEIPLADLRVHLGNELSAPAIPTVCWGFRGWQAFVAPAPATIPKFGSADSRAGAELAACLAGAMVFRFWVERTLVGSLSFGMDLFTMTEVPFDGPAGIAPEVSPKRLRILMVGGGSVGSAVAYFLPRLGFVGEVDPVDHDKIKVENMDRSPIFYLPDALKEKVGVIARYLNAAGIVARPLPHKWDEFLAGKPALRSYDLWLPLANEFGVRRAMQANFPPTSVQASTGANWNVSYGRHIPFVDDCQIDRFPSEPAAPLACGGGQIVSNGHKEDAAFPFCSFTAGLFVAAAVIRAALGAELKATNSASLSFRPQLSLWTSNRRPKATCMCAKMDRAVWEEVWGSELVSAD